MSLQGKKIAWISNTQSVFIYHSKTMKKISNSSACIESKEKCEVNKKFQQNLCNEKIAQYGLNL